MIELHGKDIWLKICFLSSYKTGLLFSLSFILYSKNVFGVYVNFEYSHMWTSEDVKIEVDVGSVEDGEAVEHQDLGVGLGRLAEQALFEGRLLLERGENVEVVAEDTAAVIVQDQDALDGV
jgi:hypothetical protein